MYIGETVLFISAKFYCGSVCFLCKLKYILYFYTRVVPFYLVPLLKVPWANCLFGYF